MSAQLTGEGESPSAQRFHPMLQGASSSLITRFAGAVHLAAIAIPGPASQRPANGAAAEIPASLPLPPAARSRNSPAGGSTAPQFLHKKRDRKTPLVLLPPSLPERFPVSHRLPLWCASSLACTFRSPVLIRSFCLRVFAFPFGSAVRGLSRVIHPGHIRFFRLFLYRRHKKRRIRSADFCILSVCSPLFAVKCFFAGRERFEASRQG